MSDQSQAKGQFADADAGYDGKVICVDENGHYCEVPPTESMLEAVPILQRELGAEGFGYGDQEVFELDEEKKTYLLAQKVLRSAPAMKYWGNVDVLS